MRIDSFTYKFHICIGWYHIFVDIRDSNVVFFVVIENN